MALSAGTRLGPYEILAVIGTGGMGEVYRAKDTRLDRTVAIKVLPSHLSADPERKQRFEREARAISSLSHPHICALYDIGHQDGIDFLVMEYLEGETLAQRLDKGALIVDQVLRYGIEIAEALDKAHRQGIVHRDLKPGNIMLTKSGTKLLDFGLAKLSAGFEPAADQASELPTKDRPLTGEGVILGTVQYMAPEQLEGKPTDGRTDIFALGEILYETATGQRPFTGQSKASLISAILTSEPKPVSTVQPLSPPALDNVVKKCLAKNPDDRWQSAHDVATVLQWIAGGNWTAPTLPLVPPGKRLGRLTWVFLSTTLLAVLLLLGVLHSLQTQRRAGVVKTSILPPEKMTLDRSGSLAISPDGTRIAFVSVTREGQKSLWVRSLDSLSAQLLPGTEDAAYPFWSADCRFVGFFAQGKLKKVEAAGGPVQILCDARYGRGGTWNQHGDILFSQAFAKGIFLVSASGGEAKPVTAIDSSDESRRNSPGHDSDTHNDVFLHPYFLPDGRHFLYVVRGLWRTEPDPEDPQKQHQSSGIYLGSLDSNMNTRLLTDVSRVEFAPPGYLLFARDGNLMAQPFDSKALHLTGEAFPVAENISLDALSYASFSVSGEVLAYTSGDWWNSQLMWFDREGKPMGSIGEPAGYATPRLSFDGKKLAVARTDPKIGTYDIWIVDLTRRAFSRFTFDPSHDGTPIWSPDGRQIVFGSSRSGNVNFYRKALVEAGTEDLLLYSNEPEIPNDWSPDGQYILYEYVNSKMKSDLWVLPLSGEQKPKPYLSTDFNEKNGKFSPDGKWVAYVSDETGKSEVYVQSFPVAGKGKWQISTDGGDQPVWPQDANELFYIDSGKRLMGVKVRTDPNFDADTPIPLFQTHIAPFQLGGGWTQYAVTADGKRILINSVSEEPSISPITVVLNWTASLKR